MSPRAGFGHIERRSADRWRARYNAPDGTRPSKTFTRKGDATAWLAAMQVDIMRREWRAPGASRLQVGHIADAYLTRPDIKESTRALYSDLWRLHLEPWWRDIPVSEATPSDIRTWHEGRARAGVGPTALAQSYRLLRSLFSRAVKDEVIPKSPCVLAKAATPRPAKKPIILTRAEIERAGGFMPDRYRLMPVFAWASTMRLGEQLELRRRHISADGTTVTVEARVYRGEVDTPKSEAGRRTITLPPSVAALLVEHLTAHVPKDRNALVFGTTNGTHLSTANHGVMWRRALKAAGLPPVRWHWLRHASATSIAVGGATTKDLMARMGQSTHDAAIGYQHAAARRDAEIAARLDGPAASADR